MRLDGGAIWKVSCLAALFWGCGGGSGGGITRDQDSGGDRGGDSPSETRGGGGADGGPSDHAPNLDVPANADTPANADRLAIDAPSGDIVDGAADAPATDAPADAPSSDATVVAASVSVTPDSIDFGTVKTGSAAPPVTVTVTNGTASAATVVSVLAGGANGDEFTTASDLCSGHQIAAQGSCTVSVVFIPQELGARAANLTVISTDAGSPHSVLLGGTGTSTETGVAVSPAAVSFGMVVIGSSSPLTVVTVSNHGTGQLSISTAALAGARPGDFALSDDGCSGTTVAPGASCAVSVGFVPHEVCTASKATLTFSDDGAGSPQAVSLSGGGVAGTTGKYGSLLYCTSNAITSMAPLGDGDVGFTEYSSNFTPPPAVGSVNTRDGVRENTTAVQYGWEPNDLTVAPDGTSTYFEQNLGGTGLLFDFVSPAGTKSQVSPADDVTGPIGVGPDGAFWIAADHMCEGAVQPFITKVVPGAQPVYFMPDPGWLSANIGTQCAVTTVMTAGPDGNVWLGLTQNFQSLHGFGFARLTTTGVFVDFIPTSGGGPVAVTMAPDGNLYALIGGGGSCRFARFNAKGVETALVSTPAGFGATCIPIAGGADGRLWQPAQQFDGAAFVNSLAAFDPSNGALTYYPTPPSTTGWPGSVRLAGGPDQGIWFNLPSAVGRFDLGGGPGRAFVRPATVGFPTTDVGLTSPARAVTVLSTGTGPLTIAGISLGGSDPGEFVVADGCTGQVLAPGSSCNISVSSKPTRIGSSTAALIIASDDAFGAQTVSLATFTMPPPPVANPAHVPFPDTQVGMTSNAAVVTLTNPADKSLNVSGVVVQGGNADDFTIVTDQCGGTAVPAKGNCTVTVSFSPKSPGARTASLTFTDAASPPTQAVTLGGSGLGAPDAGTQGAGDGGAGGACGCSPTGAFVDPALVAPSASSSSPHGLFTLAVASSNDQQYPVMSLTVSSASGMTLLTFNPPIDSTWPVTSPWGFSPDDKRFVVHLQNIGNDVMYLFDLTSANPSMPAWTHSLPIAPGGTATSPSGSVAFSPAGDYLVATQLQTPMGSLLQTLSLYVIGATGAPVKALSWNPYNPPQGGDAPDTTVGSAFWGFGPGDQSFTYLVLDANGVPTLNLLALPAATVVQSLAFTSSLATYVQYGPCGEVMAVVDQITNPQNVSPPNPVTISLYSTSTADAHQGALAAQSGLPTSGARITLSADANNYTAQSADYQNTVIVAPNNAAAACRDR